MLQQTPKKDKKARSELEERLKQMEADMKKRHETELKNFDAQVCQTEGEEEMKGER